MTHSYFHVLLVLFMLFIKLLFCLLFVKVWFKHLFRPDCICY